MRSIPQAREKPFIKVCTLTDDNSSGSGIVELPTFVALRIPNEDTLLHMRAKVCPLVSLYMHIGSASPDTQVTKIRLATMPDLIRSLAIQRRGRTAVENMNSSSQSFTPE